MKKFKLEEYPVINEIYSFLNLNLKMGQYMLLDVADEEFNKIATSDNIDVDDVESLAGLFELSGFIYGYVTAMKIMQGKLL